MKCNGRTFFSRIGFAFEIHLDYDHAAHATQRTHDMYMHMYGTDRTILSRVVIE